MSANTVDKRLRIAIRKIRPAHRPPEQRIASQHTPVVMIHKDDMPRRMARNMRDMKILPQQMQDFSAFHKAIRRNILHARNSESSRLFRDALQQELIPPVRPYNGNRLTLLFFKSSFQGSSAAGMIQMTMRQKNGLNGHPLQMLKNVSDISAGIHHNGTTLIIRENGAVLPQRRYRHPLRIQRSHSSPFQTVRSDVAIQRQPLRDK